MLRSIGILILALGIATVATSCAAPATPDPIPQAPMTPPTMPTPTAPQPPSVDDFAPPRAMLTITVGGQAVPALLNVDTVTFDASRSTGEDLTYRVDFWDGTTSASIRSERRIVDTPGRLPVRLTVTDRFGRMASDADDFFVDSLTNQTETSEHYRTWFCGGQLSLYFDTEAPAVRGRFNRAGASGGSFSGVVDSDRSMHLNLSDGVGLDGSVTLIYSYFGSRLELTESGGAKNGRLLICGRDQHGE